jgi:hypothetical protein
LFFISCNGNEIGLQVSQEIKEEGGIDAIDRRNAKNVLVQPTLWATPPESINRGLRLARPRKQQSPRANANGLIKGLLCELCLARNTSLDFGNFDNWFAGSAKLDFPKGEAVHPMCHGI